MAAVLSAGGPLSITITGCCCIHPCLQNVNPWKSMHAPASQHLQVLHTLSSLMKRFSSCIAEFVGIFYLCCKHSFRCLSEVALMTRVSFPRLDMHSTALYLNHNSPQDCM